MTFQSPSRYEVTSGMVSTFSRESAAMSLLATGSMSSATYPATNRAYYYPIYLPTAVTVYKLWWANGATASTNNIQVGVYLADGSEFAPGTRVIAGTSTLASGANALQFDDITNTALGPGRYWLAIWCNGTTTTLFRQNIRYAPCYTEDSLAGGLPATATPGANNLPVHIFGLQIRSAP